MYSGSHNTIDIWSVTEPFGLKGKVDHQFGSVYSLAITSKYIIAGEVASFMAFFLPIGITSVRVNTSSLPQ